MRRTDRAVEVMARRTPWILRGVARLAPATDLAAEHLPESARSEVRSGTDSETQPPPAAVRGPRPQFRQFAVLAVDYALAEVPGVTAFLVRTITQIAARAGTTMYGPLKR